MIEGMGGGRERERGGVAMVAVGFFGTGERRLRK